MIVSPLLPPAVVMKLDIEGSEVEVSLGHLSHYKNELTQIFLQVVSDLLISGAMKHISTAFIEWHPRVTENGTRRDRMLALKNATSVLSELTEAFKVVDVDDETYGHSDFAFLKCY